MDLKAGRCEVPGTSTTFKSCENLANNKDESNFKRLSELRWRNSMCPPHLRSSYATETGLEEFRENEVKSVDTSATHLLPSDNVTTGRRSTLSSSGLKWNKDRGQGTSYRKPGPPTPSKHAGRNSIGGRNSLHSSDLPRDILKEKNDNKSTNTGAVKKAKASTPNRIKAMFGGSKTQQNNEFRRKSRRRISLNISRKLKRSFRCLRNNSIASETSSGSSSIEKHQQRKRLASAPKPGAIASWREPKKSIIDSFSSSTTDDDNDDDDVSVASNNVSHGVDDFGVFTEDLKYYVDLLKEGFETKLSLRRRNRIGAQSSTPKKLDRKTVLDDEKPTASCSVKVDSPTEVLHIQADDSQNLVNANFILTPIIEQQTPADAQTPQNLVRQVLSIRSSTPRNAQSFTSPNPNHVVIDLPSIRRSRLSLPSSAGHRTVITYSEQEQIVLSGRNRLFEENMVTMMLVAVILVVFASVLVYYKYQTKD
ncbi:uncharacterized protein LOC113385229 [Ctenocephalides felis]|uniref:uncharacterized protein LOC113385229 n=1 Tax=Ctenocephalides felis TaxID=7515 RepID=UPI000E6E2D5D|nr:uncharacterized protein LOC113385229 [Ctenocephalides felis]